MDEFATTLLAATLSSEEGPRRQAEVRHVIVHASICFAHKAFLGTAFLHAHCVCATMQDTISEWLKQPDLLLNNFLQAVGHEKMEVSQCCLASASHLLKQQPLHCFVGMND